MFYLQIPKVQVNFDNLTGKVPYQKMLSNQLSPVEVLFSPLMTPTFPALLFSLYGTGATRTHPESQAAEDTKPVQTNTPPHPTFNSLKDFCSHRATGAFLKEYVFIAIQCKRNVNWLLPLIPLWHVKKKKKFLISKQFFSLSLSPSWILQFLLLPTSQQEFIILHYELTGFGCLVTITSWWFIISKVLRENRWVF